MWRSAQYPSFWTISTRFPVGWKSWWTKPTKNVWFPIEHVNKHTNQPNLVGPIIECNLSYNDLYNFQMKHYHTWDNVGTKKNPACCYQATKGQKETMEQPYSCTYQYKTKIRQWKYSSELDKTQFSTAMLCTIFLLI